MNDLGRRAELVRRFNRLYTREIGVLTDRLLDSPYSLAEARVLYELAQAKEATANGLARALELDAGYLSRILAGFRKRKLMARHTSAADRRRQMLSLTGKGRREFGELDRRSREQTRARLEKIPAEDQEELVRLLERVEALLAKPQESAPFVLRPHRAGDLGWVVERHGALYAQEYGWELSFEGLVAEIVAQFIRAFDARREACWIAERNGNRAGSVFLVRKSDEVAQLRLLLVEPWARGHGLGRQLVEECIRFARSRGYRKVMLWTNDILHAARHIYQGAGFRLVEEKAHHSFGKDLVGQTWELPLANARGSEGTHSAE